MGLHARRLRSGPRCRDPRHGGRSQRRQSARWRRGERAGTPRVRSHSHPSWNRRVRAVGQRRRDLHLRVQQRDPPRGAATADIALERMATAARHRAHAPERSRRWDHLRCDGRVRDRAHRERCPGRQPIASPVRASGDTGAVRGWCGRSSDLQQLRGSTGGVHDDARPGGGPVGGHARRASPHHELHVRRRGRSARRRCSPLQPPLPDHRWRRSKRVHVRANRRRLLDRHGIHAWFARPLRQLRRRAGRMVGREQWGDHRGLNGHGQRLRDGSRGGRSGVALRRQGQLPRGNLHAGTDQSLLLRRSQLAHWLVPGSARKRRR